MEEEQQQHDDYYDDEDEHEAGGRGYDEEGDSVEEEEDDEEEEEAVRAALGAKKTTASSAAKKKSRHSGASTSGRRSSPDYRRDASLDADDQREEEEEEEASPSGLMKLDRNGRPVPADRPKNKGKGRASDLNGSPAGGRGRQREVDVIQQQEEEVVQQQEYVEQDDYYQDDFGGGGDDEEGEGQYDPRDYGDAGGDDDFDSPGEEDGDADRHDVAVQEVDEDGNPISDQDEQMQGPSSRPYAAKNKGKSKGKGKAKSNPRTQSESPQRRSTAGNTKQARNRSRQNQSQQPVITEISRKRAREAGTVDIDGGEFFSAPSSRRNCGVHVMLIHHDFFLFSPTQSAARTAKKFPDSNTGATSASSMSVGGPASASRRSSACRKRTRLGSPRPGATRRSMESSGVGARGRRVVVRGRSRLRCRRSRGATT